MAIAVAAMLSPLAAPAHSGDAVRKRVPEMRTSSWSGFYVGGNLGHGWSDVASSGNFLTTSGPLVGIGLGTFNPALTFPGDNRKYPMAGVLGGFQVGYNRQLANFVVGVETDWQRADLRGVDAFSSGAAGPSYDNHVQLDWFGTLRGRLGYNIAGWLPYVTAGLAYGRTESTLTIQPGPPSAPGGPPFNASFASTVTGYAAGGGVEVMLGSSWSMKVEYLRIDLGATDILYDYGVSGSSGGRARNPFDIARGGVNYRF